MQCITVYEYTLYSRENGGLNHNLLKQIISYQSAKSIN